MACIDPDSPREQGRDVNGRPVELGDTDSMGYLCGYIDEQGLAWESRREQEVAVCAGNYFEAWREWNRSGGVLGQQPDPRSFAQRYASVENQDEAERECRESVALQLGPFRRSAAAHANQQASLN